jgi:hypothetical protein
MVVDEIQQENNQAESQENEQAAVKATSLIPRAPLLSP